MFEHLVEDNELTPVMEKHGLKLPQDLVFIREQIVGPPNRDAGPTQEVKHWGGGRSRPCVCVCLVCVA